MNDDDDVSVGLMKNRLPSTGSLLAFEASARHLSFTRAASELNLSQTAISHQIKILEDRLGTRLFLRERNGIKLSDAGRDYLSKIGPALFEISAATGRASEWSDERSLVVACLATFSIKCLLPKLHSFRALHPEITLRLMIVDSFNRLEPNSYDVGVRYGVGDWPEMQVERLTQEQGFPVCSPRLREARNLVRPHDLLSQTLIRIESELLRDFWPPWLEAAGLRNTAFTDEIRCNRLSTSIQAAIDSVGVAIARSSIVQPDLDSGALVEPFSLRISAGSEGYYIVVAKERANLDKVRAFRSWALATLAHSGGQQNGSVLAPSQLR